MTERERFLTIMNGGIPDALPIMFLEPFETIGIANWRREGMPPDMHPREYFHLSTLEWIPVSIHVAPTFEERILEETETEIVKTTIMNATVRCSKEAPDMYYGFIDHPVKNLADFEAYRCRFDAATPGRIEGEVEELARKFNASSQPVTLMMFPFFFRIGFYLLGMERFMLAFYEQPELLHAMFSHFGQFALDTIRPLLGKVKIDVLSFGEDLAYKNGTHVSPALYREFFLPYQNPIINAVRAAQPDVLVAMYSAGNLHPLLPLMLENGFNMIYPIERASGMDPYELRRRYGKDLRLAGGFPKEALIAGPEAIDREFAYLDALIRSGGFLPALDDMVPPEVPLAHYEYFIRRCREFQL